MIMIMIMIIIINGFQQSDWWRVLYTTFFTITAEIHARSLANFYEFRHNIDNVMMPSGSTDYFDNVMTKFIVNSRTNALKTDINLFFTITNCRIASSRSLTRRMNFTILTIKISQ